MKDLTKLLGKLSKELDRTKEKVDKINDFFGTEESKDLDSEEKGLMISQQFILNSLAEILHRRMKKIEKRNK
jgi:hypothetical protein